MLLVLRTRFEEQYGVFVGETTWQHDVLDDCNWICRLTNRYLLQSVEQATSFGLLKLGAFIKSAFSFSYAVFQTVFGHCKFTGE